MIVSILTTTIAFVIYLASFEKQVCDFLSNIVVTSCAMRPVASTCKVGTRFKGFVVKTRKANQHSNRRVKYWAKVSTSKAKPKKTTKTSKSTRKAPTKRRKLRGGGQAELDEVLMEVKAGGTDFIKSTKCDDDTAEEIRSIGERAWNTYEKLGDQSVLSEIKKDYDLEVKDPKKRPRLNALAIVMANISNAKNSTASKPRLINVRNIYNRSYLMHCDPEGDLYDQVQAQYPEFITYLISFGAKVQRGTKINDASVKKN